MLHARQADPEFMSRARAVARAVLAGERLLRVAIAGDEPRRERVLARRACSRPAARPAWRARTPLYLRSRRCVCGAPAATRAADCCWRSSFSS